MIFNIRKHWGIKGGRCHYSHASIEAESAEEVLRLAEEVTGWRRVDSFDYTDVSYCWYEVL